MLTFVLGEGEAFSTRTDLPAELIGEEPGNEDTSIFMIYLFIAHLYKQDSGNLAKNFNKRLWKQLARIKYIL